MSVSLFDDAEGPPTAPVVQETFLRRCFFVYDKTACKSEEDPPDDMIVYFYPPDVPLESKTFLIGSCSSMIEFAKNFTSSTPKVFTMDRHKMAVMEVGVLTLVLSGPGNYPDSALQKDLEHVHGAFRFFFGSFDMIMKSNEGDRAQFLDMMKELGKEIVPFVRRPDMIAFPSFDPIPYTSLAPNSNRFFLMTSEVLSSVKTESDNLGGCVLYNDTVLCSHLEPTTTLYILTRLEAMYGANKVTVDPKSPSPSELIPVFMPNEELAQLRAGRSPVIQASDDLRAQMPEFYFVPTDTGEFVGLYVLFFSKLAMAVIMNLPAMYDERHISKTRSLVHAKLFALEAKLFRAGKQPPSTPQTPPTAAQFNYLSYDKTTQVVMASNLDNTEPDQRFRGATRSIHESFASQPGMFSIMLRDHAGPIFARRVFDRETFYQHKTQPQPPTAAGVPHRVVAVPKEFAKLEDVAREQLLEVAVPLF